MKLTTRMKTRDVAFTFRMGAGFTGDVNRTHPASIEPVLIDASAPPLLFGEAVVVDPTTQGVRPLVAGDSALTKVYGVTVRAFPTQQSSGTNYGAAALGSAVPPVSGVMDVLRSGYIMVQLGNNAWPNAKKGSAVFVWIAASSGNHVQGAFEDTATGGSTIALDTSLYTFNGTADASGVVELAFNI
jgi:hypothetical protein